MFDSTQYDSNYISNTNIGVYRGGNYIGMTNKTSKLPSGFGRYIY
jgi:hypothetical protein